MPKVDPKTETFPTWVEYARLQRLNARLSAENQVLKEEISDAAKTIRQGISRAQARREQTEELERNVEESAKKLESTNRNLDRALDEVVRLQAENGALEARLARALGRTFVVSKDDEVAMLVSALVQVKEWCAHDVESADAGEKHSILKSSRPELARIRQVLGTVTRALKAYGVREADRREGTGKVHKVEIWEPGPNFQEGTRES